MRTEARLTHTGPEGDVGTSLAGSWAAGAVLVTQDGPARFDRVAVGRASIFTGGHTARLPDHGDGWRWEPHAVDGADIEAARQQLQRLMRDAESDVAEQLCSGGWLTVLDGPLHGIRHRRGLPVIGYVKTHHPRPVDTSQEPGLDSPNPELPPSARADQPSGFGNIDLDECPLPRTRGSTGRRAIPFRTRADHPTAVERSDLLPHTQISRQSHYGEGNQPNSPSPTLHDANGKTHDLVHSARPRSVRNGVSMLSRARIEGRPRPPRVVNQYIRAPAPTCTYDGRTSRPIPTSPPVSVRTDRGVTVPARGSDGRARRTRRPDNPCT